MIDVDEVLGANGLLAQNIDGFVYRPQQHEMATEVATVIDQGGVLVCEAGTGTGKTFAYLVPALLSGLKVIVSTGTKNLQDQLFHRDLPIVLSSLALPSQIALLKGRANYLCPHRMENTLLEGRLRSREMIDQLMSVKEWSGITLSGDIAELSTLPEDAPIWPYVTSTTENCLGQECPSFSKCHLVEARRKAQEADLVVINHHLLCADFVLKDEGFGELLPAADCFVIDEAHQLPEVASNFFGVSISARQVTELARDIETEYLREAGEQRDIPDKANALSKAVKDLRLVFGLELRRGPWQEVSSDTSIQNALDRVREEMADIKGQLDKLKGRGKGLDSCLARIEQLITNFGLVCEEGEDEDIRWFETHRTSFRLNRTPLDISEMFHAQMARHPGSWVFTSATLAVGDKFDHFCQQLGLNEATTALWDSPFDYPNQALWFVPKGLPDPREQQYTPAVLEVAEQVVRASRGRAFLLFTSHRALRQAADRLEERLPYPVFIQGSAPKGELLERFRQAGDAVLLATASFWEGVDVRGEALSCVVIDKLPFASPGDPVLQARIDALKKRGGNPFMEYQVPQAAIALKQGAGRLIRDVTDRGVLVICDPRLLKRGYGHIFLASMPPMARTRDIGDVEDFFASAVND